MAFLSAIGLEFVIFCFRCIVPLITVLSPILDYGRCFLRHPYEHSIKLHNDSDLPAKYELIPQQDNGDAPITFKSPQPKVIEQRRCASNNAHIVEAQLSIFMQSDKSHTCLHLSHGVTVSQWLTSCHKNRMSTRVITFWRIHVTLLTTSVSVVCFLIETVLILKAMKGKHDTEIQSTVFRAVLQMRRGNRDNLGIISHISA